LCCKTPREERHETKGHEQAEKKIKIENAYVITKKTQEPSRGKKEERNKASWNTVIPEKRRNALAVQGRRSHENEEGKKKMDGPGPTITSEKKEPSISLHVF